MKISVVIAAFDEVENITPLFDRLRQSLLGIEPYTVEMIFVIAGSDGTREALTEMAAGSEDVRILFEGQPSGLGTAFQLGFAAVADDCDYVVTLDADLNHLPEEIPGLLDIARQIGCDVLVGSRCVAGSKVDGRPLWKAALSGSVNWVMDRLYGSDVRDKTSGFRVYRASALRQLKYLSSGFAFLPEILILAGARGFSVHEAPIHFIFRKEGRSKMDFLPVARSYLALLSSRRRRFKPPDEGADKV